jgi:hypothetical protein
MKVIVDSTELMGSADELEQNNTISSSSLKIDHSLQQESIDSDRKMFSTSRYYYDNKYWDSESIQVDVVKGITKQGLDFDLNRNAFNQKDNQSYCYQATDIKLIQNEIMKPFLGSFTIHEPIGDGRYVNRVLSALILSLDEHKPTLCIYNLGNWHWVSFAALKINDEVYVLYKDSKGRVNKNFEKLITEIDEAARFITSTSCEQTWGVECGIFALKNMLIMAEQLQNSKEEFIKGFEEFTDFCSLELAQKLRAVDFAAEYVLSKYHEMNAADLHLSRLLQLRVQHNSEAGLIEQKLKEEEALKALTIRALDAGEELTNTVNTITVEIATMWDTNPTDSNYLYGYRFAISDNLKPDRAEIFGIISAILEASPEVVNDKSIVFSADHVSGIVKVQKAAINDQSITSIGIDRLLENLSVAPVSTKGTEVLRIMQNKAGILLERNIPSREITKPSNLIHHGLTSDESASTLLGKVVLLGKTQMVKYLAEHAHLQDMESIKSIDLIKDTYSDFLKKGFGYTKRFLTGIKQNYVFNDPNVAKDFAKLVQIDTKFRTKTAEELLNSEEWQSLGGVLSKQISPVVLKTKGLEHLDVKSKESKQIEKIPEYITLLKTKLYEFASSLGQDEKDLLDSWWKNNKYNAPDRVVNFLIELLSKYYDSKDKKKIKASIFDIMIPILDAEERIVLTKESQTFLEHKLVTDRNNTKGYVPAILQRGYVSNLQPDTVSSLIELLDYYNTQLLGGKDPDKFVHHINYATFLLAHNSSNLEDSLLYASTTGISRLLDTKYDILKDQLGNGLVRLTNCSLESGIKVDDLSICVLAKMASEGRIDKDREVYHVDARVLTLEVLEKVLKNNHDITPQAVELLVDNLDVVDTSVVTSTLKVFSLIAKQNGYLPGNAIYAASWLVSADQKVVKQAAIDFLANVCSNSKYDYSSIIDPHLGPLLLEEVLNNNRQAAVLLKAILQAQVKGIGGLCLKYLGEDRYLEIEKIILAGSESYSLEAKCAATLLIRQAVLEHHDPVLPQELLQVLSAAADNVRSSDLNLRLYSIDALKVYFTHPGRQLGEELSYALTRCSGDDLSSVLDIFELKESKLPGVAVTFLAGLLVENADGDLRRRAFEILTRAPKDTFGEEILGILEIEEIAGNLTFISSLEDPDVISGLVKDLNILSKLVSEGTHLTRSSLLALEGLLRGNIDEIVNCVTDLIEQIVSNKQEVPSGIIEKLIEQITVKPGSGSLLKTLSTVLEETEFSSKALLDGLEAVIGSRRDDETENHEHASYILALLAKRGIPLGLGILTSLAGLANDYLDSRKIIENVLSAFDESLQNGGVLPIPATRVVAGHIGHQDRMLQDLALKCLKEIDLEDPGLKEELESNRELLLVALKGEILDSVKDILIEEKLRLLIEAAINEEGIALENLYAIKDFLCFVNKYGVLPDQLAAILVQEDIKAEVDFNQLRHIVSRELLVKEIMGISGASNELLPYMRKVTGNLGLGMEDQNADGENLVEVLKERFKSSLAINHHELNEILYQFAISSKFGSSKEKDLSRLLEEIEGLNEGNPEIAQLLADNKLEDSYLRVVGIYGNRSKIIENDAVISTWEEGDIRSWARVAKNHPEKSSLEFIEETIAVIKQANKLFCGHDLRIVQIISLLAFFMGKEGGRLLQISTGEGKSTTTAGLAIIKALQGAKVDIVTSSPILARRDAGEKASLFAMFGLSASHNCDKADNIEGFRGCYAADIIYGDVANFQYDVLRHEYKGYGTRGKRVFECVIVDEVDSMLIDESGKIAMLASHLPGSEYVQFLYSSIWLRLNMVDSHLARIDNGWVFVDKPFEVEGGKIVFKGEEGNIKKIDDINTLRAGHLEDYINELLSSDRVKIPEHLKEFAALQRYSWIKNAITAKNLILEKDYVIIRSEKGYEVIAPVDYRNTGLIHTNTNWTNGLHQFLQIKHGLRLSCETLTTSFISNMEYFKRYGHNIYGMSGTLGSSDSQDLLKSTYGVELTFIPTYKEKQFLEIPAILTEGEEEWYNQIISSIKKQVEAGRAVLVINESIKVTQQIRALLLGQDYAAERIKIYSSSLNSENEAISGNIYSGDIILATNLAGRGTDIKTTSKLEKSGGLHVIVSFLPTNSRVEEQAFGRTSRQGNKGSGQIIANTEVALEALGYHNYPISNLGGFEGADKLKDLRNHVEEERLLQAKLYESSSIGLDDELFKIYSLCLSELKSGEKNQYKLQQLEELWGIKLKELKLLGFTREEERELKEIARQQGFKVLSVGDRVGNIYRAISLQLEHSITADELQGLALAYLLNDTDPSNIEAIRKVVGELDDIEILKTLSAALRRDIIVISNNGSKELHIKNTDSKGVIYLGLIAETKVHPGKWCSLEYLWDTGSIKGFKEINVSSLFEISREDLCSSKVTEALKYLREKEVVEAEEHNRNLREAVLREFERFKNHVTAKYKEGYSIISNPAYMIKDAYNRMGVGNSYEKSISILKQAATLDPFFSFAAYYNLAYCTIRHGEMVCAKDGKAWTIYTNQALGYLIEVKNQIEQNVMPNLSVIQMLSEHQGETPLMRQVIDKIALLKKQLEYIEKIIPTMTENVKGTNGRGQNAERSYIVIDNSDVKLLKELYDSSNAPLDEIGELNSLGIIHLYGVRVEELPVDWGNVILTTALGIGQLIVGCVCAMSGNIKWAATFIMNGFEDLIKAGNIASNEDFRWSEYGTGKAINYGVTLALAKIDSIVTKVGMFSNEATKKMAEQGAKHCITEVAKEIALRVAINKTVDSVFDQGIKNLVKEFNPQLEREVTKEVSECFSSPELRAKLEELLIMDAVKGNRNNQQKLHNSAMSALKQHGEELRAIITGLVNGLCGSHDPRVKVVGYLGKTISIGDALMKISDLTDKVCMAFQEKAIELAAEETDLARFICSKLGIRLNLSEAREIVRKLEEAGIINDGKLQAEKVLLREGDTRNPRTLKESERPEVFKQNLGIHNDLIAESLWQLCKAQQPTARSGTIKIIDSMESELAGSITKTVLSRVQHQVARPVADSYINDIKKNITEELKNIHEDIQSSISGKPRVYGNWDNRPDGVGKRIADIFRIRDEKEESAKRLLQTEIIEQRLAFESMGINARGIDTNYVMGDLPEGGQALAGTSEKDKTGKPKQPTSISKPFDYSLLLAQKTDGELVQLNKASLEYLKYFFDISEAKTQKAEEVKVYDVTRSTAQSSMFFSSLPRVSFIPTANAYTAGGGIALMEIELGIEGSLTAIYGLGKGAVALGRTVLPIARGIPCATVVVGGVIGLHNAAQFEHEHPFLAPEFNDIMTNPLIPQDIKDRYWQRATNDPKLVSQQQSLRVTELPSIDFKVMGRIDQQRHGDIVSAYFDIDPNANKQTTLSTPIPYQPKSILFTPDDDRLLEWSKLPGFTPIHTSVPRVETFPVHEEDQSSWILLRDKTNEEIYQELGGKATSEVLGELPNVQGSYGDNVGLRLKEACDQLYNAPKHENRVIAGAGSNVAIKDIERITKTYGGTEEDWAKLSSKKIEYKEGTLVSTRIIKIEIHWYENIKTGEKVEAKPKITNNKWNVD